MIEKIMDLVQQIKNKYMSKNYTVNLDKISELENKYKDSKLASNTLQQLLCNINMIEEDTVTLETLKSLEIIQDKKDNQLLKS